MPENEAIVRLSRIGYFLESLILNRERGDLGGGISGVGGNSLNVPHVLGVVIETERFGLFTII